MTHNFASLELKAFKAGFKSYSDCRHSDRVEYPNVNISILTCLEGKHNGEVVEIWYDYYTGRIISASIYSQFKNETPTFSIN